MVRERSALGGDLGVSGYTVRRFHARSMRGTIDA
jgi:hypothetical protein